MLLYLKNSSFGVKQSLTCIFLGSYKKLAQSYFYVLGGGGGSPGTSVSSTNKTDCHDIPEILLKVALKTITLILTLYFVFFRIVIQ